MSCGMVALREMRRQVLGEGMDCCTECGGQMREDGTCPKCSPKTEAEQPKALPDLSEEPWLQGYFDARRLAAQKAPWGIYDTYRRRFDDGEMTQELQVSFDQASGKYWARIMGGRSISPNTWAESGKQESPAKAAQIAIEKAGRFLRKK